MSVEGNIKSYNIREGGNSKSVNTISELKKRELAQGCYKPNLKEIRKSVFMFAFFILAFFFEKSSSSWYRDVGSLQY